MLKLVGTSSEFRTSEVVDQAELFGYKFITGKFKALVISKVKTLLAKIIKENSINILEIDEYIDVLSQALKIEINKTLEDYGLTMPEFYVVSIKTPDDDPNFRRMKQQYAEQYLLVKDEQIKKNVAMAQQQRRVVEAQTGAQEEIIAAQARAEAYRLQAQAEAQEMQMKGYTYQDETKRQVSLAAMENLPQGGGAGNITGMVSDMVGLGVTLGAVGGVVDMTKNMINPIIDSTSNMMSNTVNNQQSGWKCSCGEQNIKTAFCPNCGSKKPEEKAGWNCNCGEQNIKTNFCPNCGSKKLEEKADWNCSCGEQNIKTVFCPNCGSKRGA